MHLFIHYLDEHISQFFDHRVDARAMEYGYLECGNRAQPVFDTQHLVIRSDCPGWKQADTKPIGHCLLDTGKAGARETDAPRTAKGFERTDHVIPIESP